MGWGMRRPGRRIAPDAGEPEAETTSPGRVEALEILQGGRIRRAGDLPRVGRIGQFIEELRPVLVVDEEGQPDGVGNVTRVEGRGAEGQLLGDGERPVLVVVELAQE